MARGRKKVSWEEAQRRLDKFNMTLISYNGMSKSCVVQCNECKDIIQFNSCVSATTEKNRFGGNGGCALCQEWDIEELKIKLTRCEFRYHELLENDDITDDTEKSIMILESRMEAIKNRIAQLEDIESTLKANEKRDKDYKVVGFRKRR